MLGVRIGGLETKDLPYTLRVYGISEDLFEELVDEDTNAELIDGVMIVHSPASLEHEDIGTFLGGLMRFYADARSLGLVIGSGNGIVRLGPGRRLAPDIFFIAGDRVKRPRPKQFDGAPDLVVEVLSPSNRNEDLHDKRPAYRSAGVKEIWLVDAVAREILIDRSQGTAYIEEKYKEGPVPSNVLPGFWIDASWLWSEPLPSVMDCIDRILAR